MRAAPSTFLVDSNILVYAVDLSENRKHLRSIEVLSRLDISGRGTLSVQILGESYNAMTRRLATTLSEEDAAEIVLAYSETWPVFGLTLDVVEEAIRISRQFQLSYWDGLLFGTARGHGVSRLLTEDLQDHQIIEGVRIINPLVDSFDLALLD